MRVDRTGVVSGVLVCEPAFSEQLSGLDSLGAKLRLQFQINANAEVGALVLVLANADVSPSELWNKIFVNIL
jgi:hypothetical protein